MYECMELYEGICNLQQCVNVAMPLQCSAAGWDFLRQATLALASWANLLTASSMTSSMARMGPLHNSSAFSPSSPRIFLT